MFQPWFKIYVYVIETLVLKNDYKVFKYLYNLGILIDDNGCLVKENRLTIMRREHY